jgi:hypothetical protein
MKPTTKIAIAGLLSAAGSLLHAFATEFGAAEVATSPEAAAAPEAPKKRGPKPAAAAPAEPAAPEVPAEPQEQSTEGKSYEELRALIEPLVKGGQGEDVKKVIAKYSQTGLKGMEAKHHAAFEKDIQALAY